jgi:RHS repeat-associated protein/uncharacterized repeat protein (TIGR01451 family)
LSLNPRQRRADDSAPIAHLGRSESGEDFRLALLGRTPFGRGEVKLEWEVKPLGTAFDGSGTSQSASWLDSGTAGVEISQGVENLSANSAHHWRVRLRYHPASLPFQGHSRWLTMPWNGWEEQDFLTTYPPLVADFSADPLTGSVPLTVTFTNLSTPTAGITGTLWAYGDDTTSATSAVTHTHSYTQNGVYSVSLSIEGPGGSDVLTRAEYITVTGTPLLTITKSGPSRATPGELITYTLVVTNVGDASANNLLITDTIPISAYYVSGGTQVGDVVSWTLGLLPDTASTQASFVVSATQTITNSDYRVSAEGDVSAVGQEVVVTTIYTTSTRVISYTYDPLYRLTDADYSSGESFAYTYDAVGNRQALTETLGVTPTVHSYQYDDANRLVNVDGQAYTWDDDGNLLNDGVRSFAYDAANRLTSVTSGTLTTTYQYDGLGNRVAQTVDGVETSYVLDVAGGLPEVIVATTDGASTYYVQVGGQILAQEEAGAWAYVLPDHLGSVRQLADADGQVTLAQSFDPFGVLLEANGSGASEFGYTGEWWGSYMELLFLRARHYDPASGRFISKDVFPGHPDSPQSLNGWSYVGNNPLKYTDPSGLIYIEGWGYTCDDPAVVNGMGPDGNPCIPAPPGATLETLNLCSPLHPGDESWKSRPQCNYVSYSASPSFVKANLIINETPPFPPNYCDMPSTPDSLPLDAMGWRVDLSVGFLAAGDINADVIYNVDQQLLKYGPGGWEFTPGDLDVYFSLSGQGATVGGGLSTGPLFLFNLPANDRVTEWGWKAGGTLYLEAGAEVEVFGSLSQEEYPEGAPWGIYTGGGIGDEASLYGGGGYTWNITELVVNVARRLSGQ